MNLIKKYKLQLVIFFILCLASCLRFYHYYTWSLSNDELSALNRLNFSSFHDLIKYGVIPDFHPAGVQVFLYYWVKLFGNSEASVRLPFVIAGIISVYLAYLISSRWFNKLTGLTSALFISFLQYPILYSQLARPYSLGLLFSLLTVWFWTNILFNKSFIKPGLYYIGFIASVAVSAYIHYFSALFVGLVYVTGLFYINKKIYLYYILSVVIVIILYIPHFNILFVQLSKGGVGGSEGWLDKPDNDWLINYLSYCFNNSKTIIILVILIPAFSLILNLKQIKFTKFHLISLLWFIMLFIIGFVYSIYINPVLQYSILLFSFPFLLFFAFSFMPEKINFFTVSILIGIGIVGVFDTVYENKYYDTYQFGNFKGVASDINAWNKKYKNITYTININHPYYIKYYLNRLNTSIEFKQDINDGAKDLLALKKIVDSSENPYFFYARLRQASLNEIDIISIKYPFLKEYNNYNNLSEDFLFSKNDSTGYHKPEIPIVSISNSFESISDLWGKDSSLLNHDFVKTGISAIRLDNKIIYSPTFNKKIADITTRPIKIIKATVWAYSPFSLKNIHFVLEFESKNTKNNKWIGSDFVNYIENNKWCKGFLYCTFDIPPQPDDNLKIYVWNDKGEPVYIDDLNVSFYSPSKY